MNNLINTWDQITLSASRRQRNQAANTTLSYLYRATYRMCAEYTKVIG